MKHKHKYNVQNTAIDREVSIKELERKVSDLQRQFTVGIARHRLECIQRENRIRKIQLALAKAKERKTTQHQQHNKPL